MICGCGEPPPDDEVKVLDPMIVVEVASPSTQSIDAGEKLVDYFGITTRIIRDGTLELDPPGITARGLFG